MRYYVTPPDNGQNCEKFVLNMLCFGERVLCNCIEIALFLSQAPLHRYDKHWLCHKKQTNKKKNGVNLSISVLCDMAL